METYPLPLRQLLATTGGVVVVELAGLVGL